MTKRKTKNNSHNNNNHNNHNNHNNRNNNDHNNNNQYNKLKQEFTAKTVNQKEYIRAMAESVVTFCTGPAGSGKSACAIALACEYLVHGKVKHIVITRPIIETGKYRIGSLPGDILEKIHPYLVPVLEEMYYYLGKFNVECKIQNEIIKVVPLEYMRGRNFHESFIILDEAQNCTLKQIKMLLTRIGNDSKCVINGDLDQSDLYDDDIGLSMCIEKLKNTRDISIVELTEQDIIRNTLISRILQKLA